MSTSAEQFDVQLIDAATGLPMLPAGLPNAVAPDLSALTSARYRDESDDWDDIVCFCHDDSDPNDLEVQRWGVVVPEGPAGDRRLALARPLMDLRAEEQQSEVIWHRIPRGLSSDDAFNWYAEMGENISPRDSPQYLLLLGDIDDISLETQERFGLSKVVGRFHAPTDAGYAAYFEKVIRWSKSTRNQAPNIFFHSVEDGTSAMALAHQRMVAPCQTHLARLIERRERAHVHATTTLVDGKRTRDELVATLNAAPRSVLFSAGNSLGAPSTGWESMEARMRRQGSLALGPNEALDASFLETSGICPGGIWIHCASYSAATAKSSRYASWLADVVKSGSTSPDETRALRAMMQPPERPFLSASALAALSHSDGPVAIVGRKDLAWTYALPKIIENRASLAPAMAMLLCSLGEGSRIGTSFHQLRRLSENARADLVDLQDLMERAQRRGEPFPADRATRALVWFVLNDARSFLLLGDPAVSMGICR